MSKKPTAPPEPKSSATPLEAEIAEFTADAYRILGSPRQSPAIADPPISGIACEACRRHVAVITYQSLTGIVFYCPACYHVWDWAETPPRRH